MSLDLKPKTHPDSEAAAAAASWSSRSLFAWGLAYGVCAGWLDLAVVLGQRVARPSITMAALRTNRHALWMIPLADVVIFGLVGLTLAVVARAWPQRTRRLAWPILTGLTVLVAALEVDGLYALAAVLFACGAGVRLGPLVERLARRPVNGLRWFVGALAVGQAVLTMTVAFRVATAESRAFAALPPAGRDVPNVLLLVLDNVRAESMSLHGHDRPTTPNLQRLAARGTRFDEARSTSSWTLPSHASLMTGRWCNELTFGFDRPLDASQPTLAEVLGRHGFVTAGFVGNTYYANAQYGLDRGFARYEDHYENLRVTPFEVIRSTALGKKILRALGYPILVTEAASIRKTAAMLNRDLLNWIDERPEGHPFFAFVNYYDAHAPFVPPAGFDTRFGAAALPDSEKARLLKRSVRIGGTPGAPGENPQEIRRRATEVARDSYESCLAYLDQELGRLFAALDRRGLTDNTLIVVTSDHGEHFGERGFSGHGRSLYRPEVHVPLVVAWPARWRSDRAPVVTDPVSNRDFAATVADLVGLGATAPFPGESLARYRRDAASPRPAPVLSELEQQSDLSPNREVPASLGPVKALLSDGKVYIRTGETTEELYDLATDRRELQNLLSHGPANAGQAHRLRDLLGQMTTSDPSSRLATSPGAKVVR